MNVGDPMIWRHAPRGGWGYTIPVPCVVRGLPSPKYALIEVENVEGEKLLRRVKRESLTVRRIG